MHLPHLGKSLKIWLWWKPGYGIHKQSHNHKQSNSFLIIMQSATSQVLLQQLKISSSTCAAFISTLDELGSLVRTCSIIFQHSVPFSGMLQSHYSITIHLFQLAANFEGGEECPAHENQ